MVWFVQYFGGEAFRKILPSFRYLKELWDPAATGLLSATKWHDGERTGSNNDHWVLLLLNSMIVLPRGTIYDPGPIVLVFQRPGLRLWPLPDQALHRHTRESMLQKGGGETEPPGGKGLAQG